MEEEEVEKEEEAGPSIFTADEVTLPCFESSVAMAPPLASEQKCLFVHTYSDSRLRGRGPRGAW